MTTKSGPLEAGDWVRLTDPKGRRHNFALEAGARFHTKKGSIEHDAIIGRPEGIVVQTSMESPYQVFRPRLFESVVSMPRGAAVVYPKDAANILVFADIFPGARVLEAGAGSGALTSYLLRAVGPEGAVVSYEAREDFAAIARSNVEHLFGEVPSAWTLHVADLADADEAGFDRVVLDLVNPWDFVESTAERLVPGGIVCAYVATTTQLSRFAETVRAHGGFTEPTAWEAMQRDWHLEGLAVRPQHGGGAHTAFLATARRMAPGERTLPRTRRPAPGAYGPDYHGPRPADLET